jgi:Ubiquitin-2 like Rad60 SUMO-like
MRLPNDDKAYPMPPPLAPYPLYNTGQLGGRLALDMREKGGVIFPMWQREAVRVQFKHLGHRRLASYAVRPFVGGVNCISGEAARPSMSHILRQLNGVAKKQDYLVVGGGASSVQYLDGIAVAPGIVRQLVALPIQSPESIEWQMTGLDDVGGLQLEIIPQFGRSIPTLYREDAMNHEIPMFEGRLLSTAEDLEMSPGTQVYYQTRCVRSRTLFDEMSCNASQERDHLTFRVEKDLFITIKMTDGNNEAFFNVGIHTKLSLVMAKFLQRYKGCGRDIIFVFDGSRVLGTDTPDFLGMEVFEVVEVCQEQVGGGFSRFDMAWDISDLEAPAIGFGASAQILQNIRRDEEDPRTWNMCAAKLLNVQILNSKVFEQVFGIPRPLTPMTFAAYSHANVPIFQRYLEKESSVHGNFNRIVSLDEAEASDRRIARPRSSCVDRPTISDSLFLRGLDGPKSRWDFPDDVSLQNVDSEWKSFESVVDLASLKIAS